MVNFFVAEFDLADLGFMRSAAARIVRPGYHPSVLLKLFIYGYLNRIASIANRIAHLEADVERYIAEMVRVDRQEEGEVQAEKVAHLAKRYGRVRQHIQHLKTMNRVLADAQDGRISLTDPDARAMDTSARNNGMVGYNVQTAVEPETHLIVTHDVTSRGHDRDLLSPLAHESLQCGTFTYEADADGLPQPRRRSADLSLNHRGRLSGTAPLLDLRRLRDEGPLHDRQGTPDHAVGT